MRGDENNRWLFAAMGLAIQMHQLQAFKLVSCQYKNIG
jgi:hypothetical protein